MRSLRGSELSKESNTPMATDTEEVIYHTSFRNKNYTIEKKKSNPGGCFGSTS